MRVTYDAAVDAAYIYLRGATKAGEVVKTYGCDTQEVNGMVNLDFDAEGRLLGIEVLDASRLLPREVIAKAERIG